MSYGFSLPNTKKIKRAFIAATAITALVTIGAVYISSANKSQITVPATKPG